MSPRLPARLRPRRSGPTTLYGVGAAKSGTTSLARMFPDLRCAHEPATGELLDLLVGNRRGVLSARQVDAVVRRRARRLDLDVDSSQFNFFLIPSLLELPDARLVLTVRRPLPWVESLMSHLVRSDVNRRWQRYRDLRFGRPDDYRTPPEEQALVSLSLCPVAAYLRYWVRHNRAVLDAVPPERLLVVRLEELDDRATDILDFAGFDPGVVATSPVRANTAPPAESLLGGVSPEYLTSLVTEICGDLEAELLDDDRLPR